MIESTPRSVTLPRALRRPSTKTMLLVTAAIFLVLGVPGVAVLGYALGPDHTFGERIFLVAIACAILFLPARIAFFAVRRRITTGTWRISDEERLKNRAKWVGPEAEKSITRMGLMTAILMPVLTVLFSFYAVMSVRDLVHHQFHGIGNWLDAVFWVFTASYWLWDLRRALAKRIAGRSSKQPNPGNA